MSKAYELGLTCETMYNSATTTVGAYRFVRLATTMDTFDLVTTRGMNVYGITQEAINPSDYGKVAICAAGGVSRLRMSGTALTTIHLETTSYWVGANASGNGCRITSTTLLSGASVKCTWAASDIVPVVLVPVAKYKL